MRNLIDVIDRCLEVVPVVPAFADLRQQAAYIQNSVAYTAPECMGDRWLQWVESLACLGKPDTVWKQQIGRIMAGD